LSFFKGRTWRGEDNEGETRLDFNLGLELAVSRQFQAGQQVDALRTFRLVYILVIYVSNIAFRQTRYASRAVFLLICQGVRRIILQFNKFDPVTMPNICERGSTCIRRKT